MRKNWRFWSRGGTAAGEVERVDLDDNPLLRAYLIQNPSESVRSLTGVAALSPVAPMIRIHLSAHERDRLELAFATAPDRKLHDRLQIVRLAARNRPHQDIAADLGITPRTVQRWLNAYLERGLDGLQVRKPPGPAPTLTDELAPALRQWVIDGPAKQGLDRANWTYPELADHLFRTRGIRVRKSAMQVFCRKHGIRPYRPTYRFLRGDPAKQATAREELAALKRGPITANWSC